MTNERNGIEIGLIDSMTLQDQRHRTCDEEPKEPDDDINGEIGLNEQCIKTQHQQHAQIFVEILDRD